MTDTTPAHDHDDVAAVVPDTSGTTDASAEVFADEAADFVHPVDHGAGTDELPVEAEPAGTYVSGGDHPLGAERVVDEDAKGDYVTPVDHGHGTEIDADDDSGDYVSPVDHG